MSDFSDPPPVDDGPLDLGLEPKGPQNADDLLQMGITPKDSQAHLALILKRRLTGLHERLNQGVTNKMLGVWEPLYEDRSKVKERILRASVTADPQLGHRVRLKYDYTSVSKASGKGVELAQGRRGTLIEKTDLVVVVKLDPVDDEVLTIKLGHPDAENVLQVSSLGQLDPMSRVDEVKKQVFRELFPHTVVDTETLEPVLVALLMRKDLVLYGPPGSGKSNLAKDIIALAKLQEDIFIVDGCQVQCNPFSLFDEAFANEVPPCPECKIRYDEDFKYTGRFESPSPDRIRIVVAAYAEGHGIEFTEGTVGLNRMHLAGYKLPKLDGSTTDGRESDFDPEGFHAGVLPRTNNGILHMDELDKLRPQALDNILEALNSNRIKPDQLRFSYPSHQLIIGTANDRSLFSEALTDRMAFLPVGYPNDPDASYAITRRAYHKEAVDLTQEPIGATHKEPAEPLRRVPMPVILERAVDVFYMRLRKEYRGPGNNPILASNRCKLDALEAARAYLVLDRIFDPKAPCIVTAPYVRRGIRFALISRIMTDGPDAHAKATTALTEFVEAELTDATAREEDVWWCETYRGLAIAKTQIPEIADHFRTEVTAYETEDDAIVTARNKILHARTHPADRPAQLDRVRHPFMNHLYKAQPGLAEVVENDLPTLVRHLLEARARSRCTLDDLQGGAS